jgi:hypothetical protein
MAARFNPFAMGSFSQESEALSRCYCRTTGARFDFRQGNLRLWSILRFAFNVLRSPERLMKNQGCSTRPPLGGIAALAGIASGWTIVALR